jgi:hypothetical protein
MTSPRGSNGGGEARWSTLVAPLLWATLAQAFIGPSHCPPPSMNGSFGGFSTWGGQIGGRPITCHLCAWVVDFPMIPGRIHRRALSSQALRPPTPLRCKFGKSGEWLVVPSKDTPAGRGAMRPRTRWSSRVPVAIATAPVLCPHGALRCVRRQPSSCTTHRGLRVSQRDWDVHPVFSAIPMIAYTAGCTAR